MWDRTGIADYGGPAEVLRGDGKSWREKNCRRAIGREGSTWERGIGAVSRGLS